MYRKIPEDLTGQIFGQLLVLKRLGYIGGQGTSCRYECQCECGKIKNISARLLKRGTQSCSCKTTKIMVGFKIRHLLIIEKLDNKFSYRDSQCWLCECECGKIIELDSQSLYTNGCKSCGCKIGIIKPRYKIDKLTVVSATDKFNNDKKRFWVCVCDCGKEIVKDAAYLYRKGYKSCGCIPRYKNNNETRNWKGYEEISGTFWQNLKRSAKSRNLEFNITIEYVWDLFLKQNRKCSLSGIELAFAKTQKSWVSKTASLDRIDSNKGYIVGNVQWIHKKFQSMKMALPEEEFIKNCQEIVDYNKLKNE